MIRKLAVANLVLLAILLASAVANVWTRDGIAQSVSGFTGLFSSLQLQATDPVVGNDSNDRRGVDIACAINDVNANTGFTDQNCIGSPASMAG